MLLKNGQTFMRVARVLARRDTAHRSDRKKNRTSPVLLGAVL